jgi:hypothetical protein
MLRAKQFQIPSFFIKIVLLGILSLWFNSKLLAQTELSKVNLYASLGAVPGAEALANVEFRLHSSENLTWYGRTGFGLGGIIMGSGGPGILGAITMLTGKGNNHFEVGGGAFFGIDDYYKDPFVLAHLDLGYRYQKPSGGLIFKAKAGILGLGVGLGYAF